MAKKNFKAAAENVAANRAKTVRKKIPTAVYEGGEDNQFYISNKEGGNFLIQHISFIMTMDEGIPRAGFWIRADERELFFRVSEELSKLFMGLDIKISSRSSSRFWLLHDSQFAAAMDALGYDKEKVQKSVLKEFAGVEKEFETFLNFGISEEKDRVLRRLINDRIRLQGIELLRLENKILRLIDKTGSSASSPARKSGRPTRTRQAAQAKR